VPFLDGVESEVFSAASRGLSRNQFQRVAACLKASPDTNRALFRKL